MPKSIPNPIDVLLPLLDSFPEFTLDEEEKQLLLQTLPGFLIDKTSSLKSKIQSTQNYLKILDQTKPLIFKWNEVISRAYEATTQKRLTADDLLTLLIDLLPNDKILIDKLIKKLDLALEIIIQDRSGNGENYAVISLYSALSMKAQYLNRSTPPTKDNDEHTLRDVSHYFHLVSELNVLDETCKEYLLYLTPFIFTEVKKDLIAYQHYFHATNKNLSKCINSIVEDFIEKYDFIEKEYICKMNPTLYLLLAKYQALLEFKTLLADKNCHPKLRFKNFLSQLLLSEDLLNTEGSYAFNSIMNMSARLFGQTHRYRTYRWNATEGKFLKVFSDTLERVHVKEKVSHRKLRMEI